MFELQPIGVLKVLLPSVSPHPGHALDGPDHLADRVLADAVIDGQVFEITDETGVVKATLPLKSVLRLE